MPRRGCPPIPHVQTQVDHRPQRHRQIAVALSVAALCLSVLASPAAAQWAAPNLFAGPPVPAAAGPHALESIAGVIDASPALRGLGRLRLQLPGGGMVQMARDGFERRRTGDVTWRGRIVGEDDSRVILTIRNGYVAGRIFRGLDEYEIRPGPGRSHVIERLDSSIEPVDEHVVPDVDYSDDPDPGDLGPALPPPYTNSPDNIQLLVFYTQQALAAAGGEQQIEVRIQSMVDQANAAFIDSGMIARISLVRAEEIAYAETGDVRSALDWLIGMNPDGSYNYGVLGIMAKREFFGADLVSMIVDNNGQCGGAAYVMNTPDPSFAGFAYSVSALSCGAGTLAHEIGHNMGFEHNPEDSPRPYSLPWWPYNVPTSYPWSYGHYVDGSFRTIMSYATPCLSGCPKALLFSNPDVSFLGSPTGIVDQRDNARTGDLTAPIVTNFMDAVTGAVVNRRVIAAADDVEQLADGSIVLDRPVLDLGGVQAVGLRFQNIHIPPGMRIDSAYLEFEAADLGSVATTVEIRAEAADNAAPFSTTPFDVTGRPATLASVPWDVPAWNTVTEKHYSPDISAVVQEVVDRPGWLENNSLVITVEGIGLRTALSHDGGAASAPLLHIEYAAPGRPETIEAPVADFSYSCTGLTCTFTDQSTDSDGTIVSWSWYFSYPLSMFAFEQNPTVTFPADGTYLVSLEIYDDQGWLGYSEKQIPVTAGNSAPVATDNAYTTAVDTPVSGNVLTDGTPDSDANGDPLTVTANTTPANGTVVVAAVGGFTYTPAPGFDGADSFTYTISDGNGGSATATVAITVRTNVVATDNVYATDEDTPLTGNVVTDGTPDSDLDGDPLTVTANTDPAAGTVSMTASGAFTYTPNANFWGTDSFTYTVSDGAGNSATATVTITVSAVNDPPVVALTSVCSGLNCVFTGTMTDVDSATNFTVLWDFGDGTTASATTVGDRVHSYTADGIYTVTLTVTDSAGATGTATETVTVANNPPVAYDKSYLSEYLTPHTIDGNVITGYTRSRGLGGAGWPDQDPDGDPLTLLSTTSPLNGVLTIYGTDGQFRYETESGFYGYDSFTYTIADNHGATATATVNITVNEDPLANFTVSCTGRTCTFTDTSRDQLGPISQWNWSFGDGGVSTEQNPSHRYSASGHHTVTLIVTDVLGHTSTETQSVWSTNAAPTPADDSYVTDLDTPLTGNVLTDGTPDSDPDGDALSVTANTSPLNGAVTMAANGAFTYTPNANFSGTDSFTYTVSDGIASATATVTIAVNAGNTAPVATDNAYTTAEDVAVSGNVLTDGAPDSDANGDALTVTANTSPLNGTATVAGTGAFTYTPGTDFNGTDSFTYTISDGTATATATVTITVTPVNDPPVAAFSYDCAGLNCYFTNESTDVDGGVASWSWSFGDGGTSTVYTVPHVYATDGTYAVTLSIADNDGATDAATQNITVANTAPVAVDDAYTVAEDSSLNGNVLTDGTPDSDADGDALTVMSNTAPASGSVTVGANGNFTYTPNPDFNGTDSFTYTITDGNGGSATATATITVLATNDPPVATDNAYTTAEDVAVGGNVLTDGVPDSDIDGDSIGLIGRTNPLAGTLWLNNADGAFIYTPNADFNGTDSFTYTITDGRGTAVTATVTITVTPVNDAPVANFTHSCNSLSCGFTDGSSDIEGAIASWSWSFGDGAVSTAQNPAHRYAADGTYTVSLAVADSDGTTDTVTQSVTVANTVPVATDNVYTTDEDVSVSGNVLLDGTPDSDADGDALSVTANSHPLNGTVTVAVNGAFTYTPNADFYGTDSFSYTVSDGTTTASATVSITVNPVNDAPVATDNTYTTAEDTALGGNVMTDGTPDSDSDGDVLTAVANTNPLNGSLSLAANGAFSYTPAANFHGTDSFTYTVSDGIATAGATVTITVNPVNDTPVATANAYTTAEDVAVSGNVLLDGTPDSDADGDALTITTNTSPLNGTVTIAATGAFTYAPNADFNGSDSFNYTVSDGTTTASATVSITVNSVNDAPVAAFSFDCAGLNCGFTDRSTDIEGAIASWSWSFGDGSVSNVQSPTHSYAADGTYTVSLTVTDGGGASNTGTQVVTVANTAPVATANAYTTDEDVAVSGNVLLDGTPDSDADGDALSVTANSSPLNGTVTMAASGAFSYTPNADFNGSDSFGYTISDGNGGGASASVTITITPVNDAPVATDNAYTTYEDTQVSGNILTDGVPDSDIDGDILEMSPVTAVAHGLIVMELTSGAFTYRPNDNFSGTDSFDYTVTDGSGVSNVATVTFTVNPVNDTPVAAFSHACTVLDCAFTDGSTDIEGVIASWAWSLGDGAVSTVQNPAHSYAASGTYTVSLTVTDGQGATDTVTQAIIVANTAPVATANAYTTDEDVAVSGNVLLDGTPDSDADGDALSVTANSSPLNGTVTMAASGAFSYTPNADFNGSDGFDYTISDGNGDTATATVTITVNPVNDAPIATADSYTTDEDTAVGGNVLLDGVADSDVEGSALTVTANTNPPNGVVTMAANGVFTYIPNADFNGLDRFTYTVSDGAATATALVSIFVAPVNDAPVAEFSFICTDLDCGFTDSSSDIDGLIIIWAWDFGDGAISAAQSPTHSYAAVDGTYTVTLTVTDVHGASDTTAKSVTVVNPFPPTAPVNLTAAVTATGNGSKATMSVTLNWTDLAINEESFVIERCEIQGGGNNATCVYAPVAAVGAGTTIYVEDLPLSSYRYRVKARNRNGDSGYSNAVEILKQQV